MLNKTKYMEMWNKWKRCQNAIFFTKVDYSPEMANVTNQQFQQLVLILNMLNVASFPHPTDESFFSKFSFLMNLCFIPIWD